MKKSSVFFDESQNEEQQDAFSALLQAEERLLQGLYDAAERGIQRMDDISAAWNRRGEVLSW